MTRVTVQRDTDAFERHVWLFWHDDRSHTLVLDVYMVETRQTKRHKYTEVGCYSRLSRRSLINITDPPLPDDVKAEAIKQFCDALKVTR